MPRRSCPSQFMPRHLCPSPFMPFCRSCPLPVLPNAVHALRRSCPRLHAPADHALRHSCPHRSWLSPFLPFAVHALAFMPPPVMPFAIHAPTGHGPSPFAVPALRRSWPFPCAVHACPSPL
ncbi:hypothetical protein CDAR_119201 [Caerostris darwini]|uniref:Uncharacterized protein n=1 Tax=Caerostris darwini TaxID=1538125 RepID=A0AAV4RIF5_9ARAC|nr:hypothetical protein CDAR_119201 [Caerostris darwini]